ncbi:MAG: hypothetical protein UV62_C0005G0028 [Parcubacteria group bacterium GW2011_GWC1_43_11]|nr:MAG: hypothetical protein UV62_C0005G0028 [Parcubacteria group bacterium GW2011_GWC1_43_11]
MKARILFPKFIKCAVLILAIILLFFPFKNIQSAYYSYSQPKFVPQYGSYARYFNALKPYQKGFEESLKPGKTIKDIATTLLKPNLTFNDLESLFKRKFSANPICFSQGGAYSFPPGRVFSAPLCYDDPEDGCSSCACQCGYVGYMWDPTTSLCGCAE